jgi:LuxR family maltose regulon positive regulatory protein
VALGRCISDDLEEGTAALYHDGQLASLREWLDDLSADELAQQPASAVHGAWIAALTGDATEAQRLLALAEGAAAIEPWVVHVQALMMRDGLDRALLDADLALDRLPPGSAWAPNALVVRGTAHALAGAPDRAKDDFATAIETGLAAGAVGDVAVAHAQLALLAARQGAWGEGVHRARAAQAHVDDAGLGHYPASAIVHAATARLAVHEARNADARAALARAHRVWPLLDHGVPWLTVAVGLEIARAHLALAEAGAAETMLRETERVLELRPRLGSLVADVGELRDRVAAADGPAGAWAMSLTEAERRLLPYLATHLTFPEIASRLFISRNTVKSEAISLYRKLGASSRSEAIERAVDVGLLESFLFPPQPNLIPYG